MKAKYTAQPLALYYSGTISPSSHQAKPASILNFDPDRYPLIGIKDSENIIHLISPLTLKRMPLLVKHQPPLTILSRNYLYQWKQQAYIDLKWSDAHIRSLLEHLYSQQHSSFSTKLRYELYAALTGTLTSSYGLEKCWNEGVTANLYLLSALLIASLLTPIQTFYKYKTELPKYRSINELVNLHFDFLVVSAQKIVEQLINDPT